jgi:hypothetical protein
MLAGSVIVPAVTGPENEFTPLMMTAMMIGGRLRPLARKLLAGALIG